MKTGVSQCEHIRDLSFAMSIISCPDFWRRIILRDGCMGMHGRSVFGVLGRLYRAMAVRMMRICGGALMGRKEKEGLGRMGRWGKQGRGKRIWVANRFLGGEQRAGEIFGECRRAWRIC